MKNLSILLTMAWALDQALRKGSEEEPEGGLENFKRTHQRLNNEEDRWTHRERREKEDARSTKRRKQEDRPRPRVICLSDSSLSTDCTYTWAESENNPEGGWHEIQEDYLFYYMRARAAVDFVHVALGGHAYGVRKGYRPSLFEAVSQLVGTGELVIRPADTVLVVCGANDYATWASDAETGARALFGLLSDLRCRVVVQAPDTLKARGYYDNWWRRETYEAFASVVEEEATAGRISLVDLQFPKDGFEPHFQKPGFYKLKREIRANG